MQDFNYVLLLQKRFAGEISASELVVLKDWINQSEENARLAQQFELLWEKSTESQPVFSLDMEAEFRQVQARIFKETQAPTRTVLIRNWVLRAAAAVAVIFVSVWGFQQLAPASAPMLVEHVADQAKRQITLPDGTLVWLRQHAKIEFPAVFADAQRLVKLDGEAYFEVAHREHQPFQIELPGKGKVEVLGTRFNVRTNNAATSILVRQGKVRYTPDHKTKGVLLVGGDKAVYQAELAEIRLSKVHTFNELAWQTGGLEFIRTPLNDVISDLESFYDVSIKLQDSQMGHCLHTAPLTNQPLEQVLNSLALTYQFQISNPTPGRYILSNGRCQ
ncbi:MAG: FecR domain-containing protein [Lewinellaceae bacterium]|nr:FecR domain-containing protein [Lewinellaceae bacterium]